MELNKLDAHLLAELPPFYGTNTIFLTAQAPHCLFTYWDIDTGCRPEGSTFLRCIQAEGGAIESEIEISLKAKICYIPVTQSSTPYFVEIGYYHHSKWHSVAKSDVVQTPADQISSLDTFKYATRPPNATQLKEKIQQYLETPSSSEQVNPPPNPDNGKQNLSSSSSPPPGKNSPSHPSSPSWSKDTFSSWTTAALSSWGASETSSSSWEGPHSSSEEIDHPEFFMDVSAEVIFYGKTCPGSSLTIDSQPVDVDKEGCFRHHLIFPDKAYEVPIISTSPDGLETQAAVLRFHRTSSSHSPKPEEPPH